MELRFKSEVDLWLAAVVGVAVVTMIGTAIGAAFATGVWGVLLILVPVALIILVSALVSYTLGQDSLVVRSGVIKWEIAYTDIANVQPTRSPLSSPAWSLDRLKISFKRTTLLISPVDRETFLQELLVRVHAANEGSAQSTRPTT